ncbi:purine permease 3-like [Andrographis paniculata]|uniref:purine permease 3-like n=1 Tax=Andrographis paniculata TaxID=175694 RepID=UPI0021E79A1E|nr:purine permease 3-like [Andrographis paniculata]
MEESPATGAAARRLLLIANCLILTVGCCGGPLIKRLYFVGGGRRIWFSSWLESGGFPAILIPLIVNYTRRRYSSGGAAKLVLMKPRVFLAATAVGILTGVDDYLYAYGVAKLPVSTSSLILATQMAFTAAFAFLIVKQKLTAYSMNSVVVLMVGAVVLGIHSGGDRPAGESKTEYFIGFLMTVAAAVLYGFILPVVELMYRKAKQSVTYTLVMEIQLVMCFFATLFCTFGMIVNGDFQAIGKEAKEFEMGETKYYLVAVGNCLLWQCFFLGVNGVIFYSSSLLSGIIMSALLPATEILAVVFFHERFQPEKGISLFLSLWGFISYFYGEFRSEAKKKQHLIKTCTNCKNIDDDDDDINVNHQTEEIVLSDLPMTDHEAP